MTFSLSAVIGRGGARPGAGQKTKQVKADGARAAEIAKIKMEKTIGGILDVADRLCKGVKRKKFYPKDHPNAGQEYYETEYDSAMIRFWIERFIPPAKASMEVTQGTPEQYFRAIQEAKRLKEEEEAAAKAEGAASRVV